MRLSPAKPRPALSTFPHRGRRRSNGLPEVDEGVGPKLAGKLRALVGGAT
jgi:hypothetical protein